MNEARRACSADKCGLSFFERAYRRALQRESAPRLQPFNQEAYALFRSDALKNDDVRFVPAEYFVASIRDFVISRISETRDSYIRLLFPSTQPLRQSAFVPRLARFRGCNVKVQHAAGIDRSRSRQE